MFVECWPKLLVMVSFFSSSCCGENKIRLFFWSAGTFWLTTDDQRVKIKVSSHECLPKVCLFLSLFLTSTLLLPCLIFTPNFDLTRLHSSPSRSPSRQSNWPFDPKSSHTTKVAAVVVKVVDPAQRTQTGQFRLWLSTLEQPKMATCSIKTFKMAWYQLTVSNKMVAAVAEVEINGSWARTVRASESLNDAN